MTPTEFIDPRKIAPRLQDAAREFAAYGRAARAIADDELQSREARLERLRALEDDAPNDHARRIVQALRKDVAAAPYRSWSELLNYCRFAAAPAGRYLAELHGESATAASAVEALYTAEALLRRLQSCRWDLERHGRVYLPADWLRDAGAAPDDIGADAATPALRATFARILDRTDRLLTQARAGMPALADRRLRRQAAASLCRAERLAAKLRRRDPLAADVALNAVERTAAVILGKLRR